MYRATLETIIVKNTVDEDDVSVFNNCITGKPKDNLTIAMRSSIHPQVEEFRNNEFRKNGNLECVLCSSTNSIHIDHYEPQFTDLKSEFLGNWKGPLPNTFEQNEAHSKVFTKMDNDFDKKWFDFHRTNAVLRVLCKKCNLSREKSRRFKSSKG